MKNRKPKRAAMSTNALKIILLGGVLAISLSGCLTHSSNIPLFDPKAPSHLITEGYWEVCGLQPCEVALVSQSDSGEWIIDDGKSKPDRLRIRDVGSSRFAVEGVISKDRIFYAVGRVNKDGSVSIFNLTIPDGAAEKILKKFPGSLILNRGAATFSKDIKEETILAVLEFIGSDGFWSPSLAESTINAKKLDPREGKARFQSKQKK